METRIKKYIELPKDVLILNAAFKERGFNLFLVGGAVRDVLFDNKIKDYDLATNAIPSKVIEICQLIGFSTIEVGISFGVVKAVGENGEYEIATFRSDSKLGDGRRPDHVEFSDIYTDVMRRDLTINALFFDIENNEIVDLVGAIDDITNKLIRTVGKAEDRFDEDKLRILRAVRFATRFNFKLDSNITRILMNGISLNQVSAERIRDEFIKTIASCNSVINVFTYYDNFNLTKWVLGEEVNLTTMAYPYRDYKIIIATAYKDVDFDIKNRLYDLKYTLEEIRDILFLIDLIKRNNDVYTLKKKQTKTSLTDSQIIMALGLGRASDKFITEYMKFELTLTGEKVMEIFNLSPSKEVGDKLKEIENDRFEKLLNK